MSRTKREATPRRLPLNCHQYKELVKTLTREKKEPSNAQKRSLEQHRRLCARHNRRAGVDRLREDLGLIKKKAR